MWRPTGELNLEIEEAYTGRSLVEMFGRRSEVEVVFRTRNEALLKSPFGVQFLSGILMSVMFPVGNLNYVIIAASGDSQTATGQTNIDDVQAFI